MLSTVITSLLLISDSVHYFLNHRKVSHPKLVRLYGMCTQQSPMYLVFEFLENGCLTEFLRSRKGCVSQETQLGMCVDVSEAMAYLESSNFIHRDLVNLCFQQLPFRSHSVTMKSKFVPKRALQAARNCLVSGDLVVKVSDFGMTR